MAGGFMPGGRRDYQRTRDGIIVQSGNVPELERQIDRGFAVRRIKIAISDWSRDRDPCLCGKQFRWPQPKP